MKRQNSILIAGGGTGGHVFSALAIGESLRAVGWRVAFVGTQHGLEVRVIPKKGFELICIPALGFKRKSLWKKIWAIGQIPFSILAAIWVIIRVRPAIVLGVGGYASFPMIAAGILLRRRTALQEQNTIPGLVNRLAGRWVDRIFLNFNYSEKYFEKRRRRARLLVTGSPLRSEILDLLAKGVPSPTAKDRTLFVFGGSQGARAINDAFIDGLPKFAGIRDLRIIHQSGATDFESVIKRYAGCKIPHEIFPFIEKIHEIYLRADIVVCRAGALSLFEIMAFERPAMLIPYPFAADNHQQTNAEEIVRAGAARMILQRELSPDRLMSEIQDLLENPERRFEMAKNCRRYFSRSANGRIVDELSGLVSG